MSQSQNQNNCLKDKEDYIIVPNSKITTRFYRKTFGLLERCHHKTLLLQLLVTRCSVQPPGCLYSTPGMLFPIGQKLLDKNNFKLLIKYVSLLVSRGGGDKPFSSANRLAGNWFYQFHSQHNHPRCPWEAHYFSFQMGVEKSPQKQGCAEPCWGKASEGNEASH